MGSKSANRKSSRLKFKTNRRDRYTQFLSCSRLVNADRSSDGRSLHTLNQCLLRAPQGLRRQIQNQLGARLQSLTDALMHCRIDAKRNHNNRQGDLNLKRAGEKGATTEINEELLRRLRAAEAGDANAQYYIGRKFEIGLGLPQDMERATRWYISAAIQGNARAQEGLALMYAEGRCVPPDDPTAAFWHRYLSRENPNLH